MNYRLKGYAKGLINYKGQSYTSSVTTVIAYHLLPPTYFENFEFNELSQPHTNLYIQGENF